MPLKVQRLPAEFSVDTPSGRFSLEMSPSDEELCRDDCGDETIPVAFPMDNDYPREQIRCRQFRSFTPTSPLAATSVGPDGSPCACAAAGPAERKHPSEMEKQKGDVVVPAPSLYRDPFDTDVHIFMPQTYRENSNLTKPELIAVLRSRGAVSTGTKGDLAHRICVLDGHYVLRDLRKRGAESAGDGADTGMLGSAEHRGLSSESAPPATPTCWEAPSSAEPSPSKRSKHTESEPTLTSYWTNSVLAVQEKGAAGVGPEGKSRTFVRIRMPDQQKIKKVLLHDNNTVVFVYEYDTQE